MGQPADRDGQFAGAGLEPALGLGGVLARVEQDVGGPQRAARLLEQRVGAVRVVGQPDLPDGLFDAQHLGRADLAGRRDGPGPAGHEAVAGREAVTGAGAGARSRAGARRAGGIGRGGRGGPVNADHGGQRGRAAGQERTATHVVVLLVGMVRCGGPPGRRRGPRCRGPLRWGRFRVRPGSVRELGGERRAGGGQRRERGVEERWWSGVRSGVRVRVRALSGEPPGDVPGGGAGPDALALDLAPRTAVRRAAPDGGTGGEAQFGERPFRPHVPEHPLVRVVGAADLAGLDPPDVPGVARDVLADLPGRPAHRHGELARRAVAAQGAHHGVGRRAVRLGRWGGCHGALRGGAGWWCLVGRRWGGGAPGHEWVRWGVSCGPTDRRARHDSTRSHRSATVCWGMMCHQYRAKRA